jgi:hypothetical protein
MEGTTDNTASLKTLQILSKLTPEQIDKLLKAAESKEKNETHEYETDVKTFDTLNTYINEYNNRRYEVDRFRLYETMDKTAKKFIEHAVKCNAIVRKYRYKKFYAVVDWRKGHKSEYWVHPIAYYTEENFPYNVEKLTHAQKFVGIDLEKRRHERSFYSFTFYTEECTRTSCGTVEREYYGLYENPLPNLTIFDIDTLAFDI